MKILSMDLSLSSPAFAVLEDTGDNIKIHHISHIKTTQKKPQNYRLFEIYNHLKMIIEKHPDIEGVVREKGFSRFPKTTQILFRVVGVSDICIARNLGIYEVAEIPPTTVKKVVTGSGKATKTEVEESLSTNFGININFKNDDESDAVGVGVTYIVQKRDTN